MCEMINYICTSGAKKKFQCTQYIHHHCSSIGELTWGTILFGGDYIIEDYSDLRTSRICDIILSKCILGWKLERKYNLNNFKQFRSGYHCTGQERELFCISRWIIT